MKALITGINGFVGEYLAVYLQSRNIEVCGTYFKENIQNTGFQIFKMDVTQKSQVLEVLSYVKPDCIFHLAAQSSAAVSWKEPQMTMEVNVGGTINILESLREMKMNPRILLVGSSEEYGFVRPDELPVNETQPFRPANPYAVSKVAQDMLGEIYSKAYGMDIVRARPFNHIGPRQNPTFAAPDFARRIALIEKGKLEPVMSVGNLEVERDFTDVRDVVKAYYDLLQKGEKGQVYNIGSGKSYKIRYILDVLLSLSEVDVQIKQDPARMRPSDVPVLRCDNTRLVKLTSWHPTYTIEETLKDVLNYWRDTVENEGKLND
ncbi:MAG: GDP-mannose 4,6-dehydratase [Tepidanaerobacteraceae bacterium]|nr:GDP-mannose 4,6-dehydratase [Tepidanaerobacteraceae bacterium]